MAKKKEVGFALEEYPVITKDSSILGTGKPRKSVKSRFLATDSDDTESSSHKSRRDSIHIHKEYVHPPPKATLHTKAPPIEVCIQVENLTYSVQVPYKGPNGKKECGCCGYKKQTKQILKDVSCTFNPGELIAVMGPSGCGKSTFLDIITGRTVPGGGSKIQGTVLINGQSLTILRPVIKRVFGYVKQDDILHPTSTVQETLETAAQLNLSKHLTKEEKKKRMKEVIDDLKLHTCLDTMIGGGDVRGVSGGERKRTAVATELLKTPVVFVLDEPTSGLDSSTAYELIKSLRRMADAGRTVICTIHQPRLHIFQLFHKLMLLRSGTLMYFGRINRAIPFFKRLGYDCPKYDNAADYFLDVLSESLPEDEVPEDAASIAKIAKTCAKMRLNKKKEPRGPFKPVAPLPAPIKRRGAETEFAGFFTQFNALYMRHARNNWRNPALLVSQLAQHIFLSLFMGLMYLQISSNQESIADRGAAIFFFLAAATSVPAYTAAFVFPLERPVFNRERASGMYQTLPYYLSATLADLPFQILFAGIDVALSYYVIGLNSKIERFGIFFGVLLLASLTVQSAALLVSALLAQPDVATIWVSVIFLLFMSFGGFFVNVANIPVYFRPLEFISPYKYAFRALANNDFRGITFECPPFPCPDFSALNISVTFGANSPAGNATNCFLPCPGLATGEQVLEALNLEDGVLWIDVVVLVGMILTYRLLAYLALRFVKVGKS